MTPTTTCPPALRRYVKLLADDLRRNRLEVVVATAPRERGPCGIRVVNSQNPDWYQKLCSRYRSTAKQSPHKQSFDTKVSRKRIQECLDKLSRGDSSASTFAAELLEEARMLWKEDETADSLATVHA